MVLLKLARVDEATPRIVVSWHYVIRFVRERGRITPDFLTCKSECAEVKGVRVWQPLCNLLNDLVLRFKVAIFCGITQESANC
jgi:hypothetical protein